MDLSLKGTLSSTALNYKESHTIDITGIPEEAREDVMKVLEGQADIAKGAHGKGGPYDTVIEGTVDGAPISEPITSTGVNEKDFDEFMRGRDKIGQRAHKALNKASK